MHHKQHTPPVFPSTVYRTKVVDGLMVIEELRLRAQCPDNPMFAFGTTSLTQHDQERRICVVSPELGQICTSPSDAISALVDRLERNQVRVMKDVERITRVMDRNLVRLQQAKELLTYMGSPMLPTDPEPTPA